MSGTQLLDILIVEDNAADRDLIVDALLRQGVKFRATIAETVGQAVMQIQRHDDPFDLSFVDLGLPPESSGVETVRVIVEQPKAPPVIVTTGNDDPALQLEAAKIGVGGYIVKNQLNSVNLLEVINTAINRHATAVRISASNFKQVKEILKGAAEKLQDTSNDLRRTNDLLDGRHGER